MPESLPKPTTHSSDVLPNPHIDVHEDVAAQYDLYHIAEVNETLATTPEIATLVGDGFVPHTNASRVYKKLVAESRKANTDKLTGLLNRDGLDLWYERYVPEKFGVLFIDIRNFKAINDKYGEAFGDRVIAFMGQTTTERIRTKSKEEARIDKEQRTTRPQAQDVAGTIGRWGGDEGIVFIDLSAISTPEEAEKIMDTISDRFENFGEYKDEETGNSVDVKIRSVHMTGNKSDNLPLRYYVDKLDNEIYALKAKEKTAAQNNRIVESS